MRQNNKSGQWHKRRDSRESDKLKARRLILEEENSNWIIEKHRGCKKNDAIQKTKLGKQEYHLSCYDKITGKRLCFSTGTLLLLYLRDNKFLEPPTFQKLAKPSTNVLIDDLMKKIPKLNLDTEKQDTFEEQFLRYIGGQLPKEDIHCCPVCYEMARDGIEGADPLSIFVDLRLNGEVTLHSTVESCFLTRDKLKSHMDIEHNINRQQKSEMKLTLDRFMLRESGGLVDRYCNTFGANFRHHYWNLDRVKMYLGMFEHRKKADSEICETWNIVHGVIDNDSEASDEDFIVGDSEVEADQADESDESSESDGSDDEVATVIVESPSPRKRKRYVVDSDKDSDTDTVLENDYNQPERCCIFCVDVEMVEMNTRKYGCDKICCNGGESCPQKGYPLGRNERFYGCKCCNEYDLCEVCFSQNSRSITLTN